MRRGSNKKKVQHNQNLIRAQTSLDGLALHGIQLHRLAD